MIISSNCFFSPFQSFLQGVLTKKKYELSDISRVQEEHFLSLLSSTVIKFFRADFHRGRKRERETERGKYSYCSFASLVQYY